MATKVGKANVTSDEAGRVRSKLAARASANGGYQGLATRKQALESKLERLRRETSGGSVRVLSES